MEGASWSWSTKHCTRPAAGTPWWNNVTDGTTSRARHGCKLSSPFIRTSGVQQGCVLVPALFCRSGRHYVTLGRRHWSKFRWHLPDGSQLCGWCSTFDWWPKSTTIRASTSGGRGVKAWVICVLGEAKVQNLGSGQEATPITVNGEVVEALSMFFYLGSTILSGSNSNFEVMRCIGLAFSVTDRLSRTWSQQRISLTTKFRLYSSCILAVLLYACKTWRRGR